MEGQAQHESGSPRSTDSSLTVDNLPSPAVAPCLQPHATLIIGYAGLRFLQGDSAEALGLRDGSDFLAATRDSSEAVLRFAIEVLGASRIVVVAQPINPSGENTRSGIGWHRYLTDVARRYKRVLDETDAAEQRRHLLHGLSAVEQALGFCRSPAVLATWRQGQALSIDVQSPDRHGELRSLGLAINATCPVDDLRRRALHELLKQARELTRRRRESYDALTQREREVLAHLCDGISNIAISRRMGISRNTVSSHLRNIYDKLGVSRRFQAIMMMTPRLSRTRPVAGIPRPEGPLHDITPRMHIS